MLLPRTSNVPPFAASEFGGRTGGAAATVATVLTVRSSLRQDSSALRCCLELGNMGSLRDSLAQAVQGVTRGAAVQGAEGQRARWSHELRLRTYRRPPLSRLLQCRRDPTRQRETGSSNLPRKCDSSYPTGRLGSSAGTQLGSSPSRPRT